MATDFCVTNYPKIWWLKFFCYGRMPVGQELGAAYLCPLALRTSEDHSQYHPGCSHLKAWLGKDPPQAHPHRCWQDPVPCRLVEVDDEGSSTHTLLARDLPHFSAMQASPQGTLHRPSWFFRASK